jgi:protein-S-isoprenylcysteine O-methyltransferase Ste14
MYQNKKIIALGNFLFKYRNFLFPLTLIAIFVALPPSNLFLGSEVLESQKNILAYIIAAIGLLIRASVIGFAYIKRGGLNKKVYADTLVNTGIFAICRNPLYVGNLIIYFSIFLMHGDIFLIIFGSLLFYFIYICLIAAEENFLRGKFGAEFDEYCSKTPRWIPAFARLKTSVAGMGFDFKKVLYKDYTTIANTYIGLVAIQLYKDVLYTNDKSSLLNLGYALVALVVFTVLVRAFKKSKAN